MVWSMSRIPPYSTLSTGADAYDTQLHVQKHLKSLLWYHQAASAVLCLCFVWLDFIKPVLWLEAVSSASFFTKLSEYTSLSISLQKHGAGFAPWSPMMPVTDPLSSLPKGLSSLIVYPMMLTSHSSCHDETNLLTVAFWSTQDQLDFSIKSTIRRYLIMLIFLLSTLLIRRANANAYIDLTQIRFHQSKWSHFPHKIIWSLVICLFINIIYIQCQMLPLLIIVIGMDVISVVWIIYQMETIEYFKQVISKYFPCNLISTEVRQQIVEETTARELHELVNSAAYRRHAATRGTDASSRRNWNWQTRMRQFPEEFKEDEIDLE